jgi:hypothetical protein
MTRPLTDLDRPVAKWPPGFIVFGDPPGQQLPHFGTAAHARHRRGEPARDFPLAEDRQCGLGVVTRAQAQPQTLGDQLVGTSHHVDVGALAHRLLLVTNPAAGIDAGLTKSHREGTKWSACG